MNIFLKLGIVLTLQAFLFVPITACLGVAIDPSRTPFGTIKNIERLVRMLFLTSIVTGLIGTLLLFTGGIIWALE